MGRILGIDYGNSRIGLAISDSKKVIAFPHSTIQVKDVVSIKSVIRKIIKKKEIEAVVIGLPLGLNGKDTTQTRIVRDFKNKIDELSIPTFFQDERYSSISAKKTLINQKIKTGYNKDLIDRTAAAILLQQYLDFNNN